MNEINISALQQLLAGGQGSATPASPSGFSANSVSGMGGTPMPTAVTPAANPDTANLKAYMQTLSDSTFGPGHSAAWDTLINNESGWNPQATNGGSGAYGLGQFLDSTWQGTGAKKTSDPIQQLNAMATYIKNRYGTPSDALHFWYNVAPTMSVGQGSHWY